MFRIFILILGVILISWCSQPVKEHVDYNSFSKTYVVTSWNVLSANKYVGTLQSSNETFVSFKMPWRIKNLYVEEGDIVKKWQLLAELDGNEVKSQFSSVKDMINSLWNVYKSTESMFDSQIASMKIKIQQAKSAMEGTQIWLADTKNISTEQIQTAEKKVNQAKIGVATAKTNLEHTKQVLSTKELNIYSNAKNAISNANIVETNFLNFVDQTFGISDANKHKNDGFENYLSAKDTSLKDKIKDSWIKINGRYKKFISSVWDLNLLSKKEIQKKLDEMKNILEDSRNLSDIVYSAIDNSVPSRNFSQSMINNFKKQAVTYQSNIEKALLTAQWNYLLWIKWALQAIQDFQKEKNMKLDLLQKQYEQAQSGLETAQQALEQYKAMASWKVNEVNTKYDIVKQQYEEALQGLKALKKQKETQLNNIKSKISQLKWNKNLAAVNLWNIRLYAPYAGIILSKNAEVGQVVWAGMPIFKIWTLNSLKWMFHVPLSQVEKIKVWDIVYIKALWTTITWSISLIHPQADPISKKVTVEVMLKKVPKNWKNGMYITWYPKNQQISWLVIPYDLVRYEYGKSYVYKKEDKNFKKVYIKLGQCDNNFCLVENGLKDGDVIR